LDVIYVVEREGFVFGEGEPGPDYGVGLDGRNEECALFCCNIVCKVGVWKIASSQIIEVPALSEIRLLAKGSGGRKSRA